MRAFRVAMSLALVGIAVGIAVGCGGGGGGTTRVPVSGKVTLDNRPLAGAKVVFIPTGSTIGNSIVAYTDAEGQYTFAGKPGPAGVPPGEYKVTVSLLLLEDGNPAPPGTKTAEVRVRESLPQNYADRTITTLRATVPATGGNFDFALGTTLGRSSNS